MANYVEDRNEPGFFWAFTIENININGHNNHTSYNNKCPFAPVIKQFIEKILTKIVNIYVSINECPDMESFNADINTIVHKLADSGKFPKIPKVKIYKANHQFEVLVICGNQYYVEPLWTMYNDFYEKIEPSLLKSLENVVLDNIRSE